MMEGGGRIKTLAWRTVRYLGLACWIISSIVLPTVYPEGIPHFLEQPQSLVLSDNGSRTLKCAAVPQNAKIQWLYNRKPLDKWQHHSLDALGSDLNISVFHHAIIGNLSDGEYRCTATTSAGTVVSQSAVVTRPVVFEFGPATNVTLLVPEGGYVTLMCQTPDSLPSAAVLVQAERPGVLEGSNTDSVHRLPSGGLVLTNITSASEGDFRCVALNPVTGDTVTSPAVISVIVSKSLADHAPTVNIVPGMRLKMQAEIGTDVVLECPSYGHVDTKILWSKDGGNLPVGRYSLSQFGNLRINSTQLEDSGTYTCSGSSSSNSSSSTSTGSKMTSQVVLEMVMKPVVSVIKQPGEHVRVGDLVEMACSVSGVPQPEFRWFHDGQQVTSNTGGTLVLPVAGVSDTGLYQCMATNSLGSSYGVMRLKVRDQPWQASTHTDILPAEHDDDEDVGVASGGGSLGRSDKKPGRRDRKKSGRRRVFSGKDKKKKKKNGHSGHREREKPKYAPSVPTVVQLSDRSVMLNWTVPDKGNGQTIKFFKVQYKEMSPERGPWCTSDAHLTYTTRRFEVADLKSGGWYKFRILAVYEDNDNKNSANTAIFRLSVQPHVQVRAPDTAPTIVEAKPVVYQQNFGIGLTWQYKAETASPIEGFIIFYKPFGSSEDKEKMIPGAGIRNDVIRDLLPNTPYNIRMQSFNTVGRSQFSNQVVKPTRSRDPSISEYYPEPEIPLKEAPEASSENPVPSRRSGDSLEHPVILGVVLGALLLALLILVTMCWWKQRQQKRRSLVGNPQLKFQDQSQCIYADPSLTKPNGALYPSNGSGSVGSGSGPHLDNHRHMNIDVNPLSEYDMNTSSVPGDCRPMLFYASNGLSGPTTRQVTESGCLDSNFQHKSSSNLHACNGDLPYMLQQKAVYPMQHRLLPHTPNTFYTELSSAGLSVNHEYSEPGGTDPRTPEGLPSLCKQNIDHHHHHGNSLNHFRNFDYSWPNNQPYPQSHVGNLNFSSGERLSPLYSPVASDYPGKPGFYPPHGNHRLPSVPSSRTSPVITGIAPGFVGPVGRDTRGGVRHKRRRKRPHSQDHGLKEQGMRDQATNTDHSSNEGTLEYSTLCKSSSSSYSGSERSGHNCGSSFANTGSMECVSDGLQSSSSSSSSSSTSGNETDPHLLPGSL